MSESNPPGDKDPGRDGSTIDFSTVDIDDVDTTAGGDTSDRVETENSDDVTVDLDLSKTAEDVDAPADECEACEEIFSTVKQIILKLDTDDYAPLDAVRETIPNDLAVSVDEWVARAERAGAVKETDDKDAVTVLDTDVSGAEIADSVDPVEPARGKPMTEEEQCEYFAARGSWDDVKSMYRGGDGPLEHTIEEARHAGYRYLRGKHDWMVTSIGKDGNKPTLWWYDPGKEDDPGIWKPNGTYEAKSILNENLDEHYNRREGKEITEKLRLYAPAVDKSELDAKTLDDPMLSVANGVVNMKTLELEPHDPSYRFTWQLDIEYDAEAVPERILRFFRDIFARAEDMWTVLQGLAEGLMPWRIDRAFFLMYGRGANGKSEFVTLIRELFLGEDLSSVVGLEEIVGNDDFASGGLMGSRANIGNEAGHATVRDVSDLKKYSGGDGSRGNRKYEQREDFTYQGMLAFLANEPPAFNEQTDAVKDRLYPIPFPNKFTTDPDDGNPDRETNIAHKIATEDELKGLLTLILQAGKDMLEAGEIECPETPDERMERYETASDPFKRFKDRCIKDVEVTPQNELDPDDVVAVYRRMCDAEDERAMTKQTFKRRITDSTDLRVKKLQSSPFAKRHDDVDVKQPTVWRGIQFADAAVKHMPDDVRDRYGFDSSEDGSNESTSDDTADAPSNGVRPIESLKPGDGWIDTAITVAKVFDDQVKKSWVDEEALARRSDPGPVNVHVRGGHVGLDAGNTYLLEGAKATSNRDDELVVEIIPGATTVKHIVLTDSGDADPNGEKDSTSDRPPQADRISKLLNIVERLADEADGAPHDDVVTEAAEQNLGGEDTVETDLDALKQKGTLYEPKSGVYRVTERSPEVGDE